MKTCEEMLSEIHIAFTSQVTYYPCISGRPQQEHLDYILSYSGHPSHPMIWISTDNRNYGDQCNALVNGLKDHYKELPEDIYYYANLYVRDKDRCGTLFNTDYPKQER